MIKAIAVTLVVFTSFSLSYLSLFLLSLNSSLAGWLGSSLSPEHSSKRHLVKSDPTPFGFKGILLFCDSGPSFISP